MCPSNPHPDADATQLPRRLERTVVYESEWINLYTDKVLLPSGRIIEKYHQLDYPSASVSILAVNDRNELCLIRSLRYTTQSVEWEVPAGSIEHGETPDEAARREFYEETGLRLATVREFIAYTPSHGMSNQQILVTYGRTAGRDPDHFDEDETASVHWFATDQVRSMIARGEITDGVTLMPLLFYLAGFLAL